MMAWIDIPALVNAVAALICSGSCELPGERVIWLFRHVRDVRQVVAGRLVIGLPAGWRGAGFHG
ncbi:MAG TPA: hypothetical protein VFM55_00130, partial [Micromonosporaceae bacterium]|nr:hypothetical protein [Micromonosporaceae bacterium]